MEKRFTNKYRYLKKVYYNLLSPSPMCLSINFDSSLLLIFYTSYGINLKQFSTTENKDFGLKVLPILFSFVPVHSINKCIF